MFTPFHDDINGVGFSIGIVDFVGSAKRWSHQQSWFRLFFFFYRTQQ